eukprot:13759011-Alexandrium_andersonii.AAC.1
MAAASTAAWTDKGAGPGGPQADRSSPPRGRADTEVAPYSRPYFGVAMTSKELNEGGAASLRLAESDSVVTQDLSHDKWFASLK